MTGTNCPIDFGGAWGLRFRREWLCSGAMKLFSLLLVAVALSGVSCERHEFEGPDGTKQLHEQHAASGGEHATGAAHAAPAEHEEKAPAH